MGVLLFFAISGFLITTLLLREQATAGSISLSRFYIRRSLRIFPLYYLVLGIYCATVNMFGGSQFRRDEFFHNVPFFLTYTANWFVSPHATFSFAWSLSTEEQFYAIWPSIERYFRRYSIAIMIGGLAIAQAALSGEFFEEGSLGWSIVRNISLPICFGVLLAHLLHSEHGYAFAYRWMGHRWSSAVAFSALLIALHFGSARYFLASLLVLVVGTCVVREDHILSALLSWRPLAYIGSISYGMYLLHGMAYAIVRKAAICPKASVIEFLAATLVTIVAAALSYHFFESHFLRLKSCFEPRRSGEPAAEHSHASAANA